MSSENMHLVLNWASCPNEILWIILKQMDARSLLSCMLVNRRWKEIVTDFIERYNLWPMISSKMDINSFQNKSLLGYKDRVMNSLLWFSISEANVALQHTYNFELVRLLNVYKDSLIVRTMEDVEFFNILDKKITRTFEIPDHFNVLDYKENDYMVAVFEAKNVCNPYIRLYGKEDPNDEYHISKKSTMYIERSVGNSAKFRLQENVCYLITDRYILWALTWERENKSWGKELLCRNYCNDPLSDMSLSSKNMVSVVSKRGLVFYQDKYMMRFIKIPSSVGSESELSEGIRKWILFNEVDAIVSVSSNKPRITVYNDEHDQRITLECADMTCAFQHGKVLMIGYKDGAIAICTPNTFSDGHPERLLFVQDLDPSIEDPAVRSLEVYEDKLSHHLFVEIKGRVLQILITYPDSIKTYFDD